VVRDAMWDMAMLLMKNVRPIAGHINS